MSTSGFLTGGTLVTPAITFPASPVPSTRDEEIQFGGTKNRSYSGTAEVYRGFFRPRRVFTFIYEDISDAETDTLRNFYTASAHGPEIAFRLLDPVTSTYLGNFRFTEDVCNRSLFDHNAENITLVLVEVFEYTGSWTTFADEAALPDDLEFPVDVVPQYDLVEQTMYRTILPEADVGGVETRVRSSGWPSSGKRIFLMQWPVLSQTDIDTLWNFYKNNAQAWLVPFTLFDPKDGTTELGQFRFTDAIARRQNFAVLLYSIGLSVEEV